MEWHISYHPLKVSEIRDCYFAVLDNPTLEKKVARQYEINDLFTQRLSEVYQTARTSQPASFQASHGFSLAVVAGILRKYWYVHGSAFSSAVEKDSREMRYSSLWKALVPQEYQHGQIENGISTHCSSGAYLSLAALQRLRVDYAGDARRWAIIEDTFSHGRLAVFWKAVDYAINHQMGLLEATDVITPDPINPNNTRCYSNVLNCEQDGILLYQEAVAQQLSYRSPVPNSPSEDTTQTSDDSIYAPLALPVRF